MRELNVNEIEQVEGGVIAFIAIKIFEGAAILITLFD